MDLEKILIALKVKKSIFACWIYTNTCTSADKPPVKFQINPRTTNVGVTQADKRYPLSSHFECKKIWKMQSFCEKCDKNNMSIYPAVGTF